MFCIGIVLTLKIVPSIIDLCLYCEIHCRHKKKRYNEEELLRLDLMEKKTNRHRQKLKNRKNDA